jgi:hypothetical protein
VYILIENGFDKIKYFENVTLYIENVMTPPQHINCPLAYFTISIVLRGPTTFNFEVALSSNSVSYYRLGNLILLSLLSEKSAKAKERVHL